MKKIILLFIMCVSFITPAEASRLPTSNVCQIEAEVLSVEKRWVAAANPEDGMHVTLTFRIDKSGVLVRKYADNRSCESVYKIGDEFSIGEYERPLLGNLQMIEVGGRIRTALVSYRKGSSIKPQYAFQATEENAPLVSVLDQ